MNIVVNNKLLELSNPTTPTERWAQKRMIDIQEKTKTIKLKIPKPFTSDNIGLLIKQPISFDLACQFRNPETKMMEKWIYHDGLIKSKNGPERYKARHLIAPDIINISTKDNPEMAFFLSEVMDVAQFGYVLENIEKESKEVNESKALEIEVMYVILKQLTEKDIRLQSYAWGIDNVEGKGVETLRNQLLSTIRVGQARLETSHRGYEAFLNEVNSESETVKLRAYINKAVQTKVIEFKDNSCRYSGTNSIVCMISPNKWGTKEDYVVNYLANNDRDREIFMIAIEGNVEDMANLFDDYASMTNLASIKSKAKANLGLEFKPSDKKTEVLEKIKETIAAIS